jgi:raffinose/stachyose/melibiose transport system substrate-binding protein
MSHSGSWRSLGVRLAVTAVAVLGLLTLGAASARTAPRAQLTITFLSYVTNQPSYSAVIQNFKRAHPNITIDVTWAPTVQTLYQLETTELAAGNAPDLLSTYPGCGTPISICKLAKAGSLGRMVGKAWARSLDRRVLSYSKLGPSLFAFEPIVVFDGLLTNDTMLKKLGLKVPQTFPRLLALCEKAKAAGAIPLMLTAQGSNTLQQLIADIALTTVYAKDPKWAQKLRGGKVTFQGTAGWHEALKEIVDLNEAGCFQPGPAATTGPSGDAIFAQGQAATYAMVTSHKGAIDASKPLFKYSQSPFPTARKDPKQTVVEIHFPLSVSVNAHASAQHQKAAQAFVDFLARPDQDALYARIGGGLSEAQLRSGRFPGYLSSFVPLYKQGRYGINPVESWWNASVGNALTTYGTGLLTGQESIDDVLKSMDAAWKLGPD